MGSALNPEWYQKRLNLFIGLAPIVRFDHTTSWPMKISAYFVDFIEPTMRVIQLFDFVEMGYYARQVMGTSCKLLPKFCAFLDDGYYSFDDNLDNTERMGDIFAHQPVGLGWKCLMHYA